METANIFLSKSTTTYFMGFRNDTKFYLFTRQNIPSTINGSSPSVSLSLQKCSSRRLLNFRVCLVIPIFTWNYGFPLETKHSPLQPEILGNRTSWQAEGFFNLQIPQACGPKLIRKRAWKSWNFLSEWENAHLREVLLRKRYVLNIWVVASREFLGKIVLRINIDNF